MEARGCLCTTLELDGSWSSFFAATAQGVGAAAWCAVLGTGASCRIPQEGRRTGMGYPRRGRRTGTAAKNVFELCCKAGRCSQIRESFRVG